MNCKIKNELNIQFCGTVYANKNNYSLSVGEYIPRIFSSPLLDQYPCALRFHFSE